LFEHKVRRGHFLEWAKVFGNYYGTPLKNVRETLKAGKSVLLCIDVQGTKLVKDKIPGAVMIFVRTPTLEDLGKRLSVRGTDTPEAVALRLKTARQEMEEAKHYDHVIINDDLNRARNELESLLSKETAL
jgi:guanylate kinase